MEGATSSARRTGTAARRRSRGIDGFGCRNVSPRGRRAERAVVYLHRGAYISHMLPQHWQLISQLADAGARVEAAQYGLAPKYTYREAYPFVTAVYRDLLSDLDAGQVTIMGDSAGPGLALGVAQSLVGSGLPQPARVVLISPWLDLTLTNPAIPEVEARDPFLTTSRLLAAGRGWAGGDDPAQPRLSPVNGPLAPWRPSTSTSALATCSTRTSGAWKNGLLRKGRP
ncbi:alpha/beta hydrolase fold domain-containing protein [Streptomyces massasporeus]